MSTRDWRWIVAVLLLGTSLVPAYKAEAGPLGGILSRSYERNALSSILGRSTSYSAPERSLVAVAAPTTTPRDLNRFAGFIDRYSAQYGVDSNLVRAIIQAESGGDPQALSPKGAAGLMQLMPDTASEMGAVDRFDPEQNIASGTRYLRSLLDRFHSVELALWAYNAGPRAVRNGILPRETEEYVPRVMRLKRDFAQREGS
ncbi:MAG: lytic transglycosylase domain-containing protein [Candidatus Latescibacterota bacterium]|nr:lytic transglycosylase domain-containing protein [Candidatus Latescibacterota bacterium]